jgi:NADH-quinone oxidoreductase subunit H
LFAMFFLAEYSFMLSMSAIMVLLFFGGWLAPCVIFQWVFILPSSFWFCFKTVLIATLFIIVRATLPRVRYDQLMNLGWKKILPVSLGYIIFLASFVYITDLHAYVNLNAWITYFRMTDTIFSKLMLNSWIIEIMSSYSTLEAKHLYRVWLNADTIVYQDYLSFLFFDDLCFLQNLQIF